MSREKGPFILRAMRTGPKPGSDLTFWEGCMFMSSSATERYCTLPVGAKKFWTVEEAERGIVEWTLRYPVVIGHVQIVDLSSFEWE